MAPTLILTSFFCVRLQLSLSLSLSLLRCRYLVLDVDAGKLKGEVKMEPAAPVGNKTSDTEILGQKL